MCGIMAYVGQRPAKNIILNGLRRLEYRGYDSAGISVLGQEIQTTRAVGDTTRLDISKLSDKATTGIGHTRWATHGRPSVANAHPHTFGDITLVHNGIIENYIELQKLIDAKRLRSQTDSEVLAGLIDHYFQKNKDLLQATKQALTMVKGTFGIAVISPQNPQQIIVARRGSPIVIGVDDDQNYIASDATALIEHTDKVVYLDDDQLAVVTPSAVDIYDLKLHHRELQIENLEEADQTLDRGHFASFLEKEIFEQPLALENVMRGRVGSDHSIVLGGPNLSLNEIRQLQHILIIGCGSAYHAGYYAKYALEELLGLPVSVEYASEFRYRHGAYDPDVTLAIFMSQSGETADTLASLREAKRRGIKTMGIINSVGSTIAREVDHGGIYLHAGVESSVASTKAYSSMVAALLMLGGFFAYRRGQDAGITRNIAKALLALPDEIRNVLRLKPQIDKLAKDLVQFHDVFYLGRGMLYSVALEGALKLTEVSYTHAQGFPAGEMKHGPISLIDRHHLSVVLLPEDELMYQKSLSTIEEIKARGGRILTIGTRPKEPHSDYHLEVAPSHPLVDGLVYNVCLQLIALAVASQRGHNIDHPRNLAKSVTVE